MHLRWNPSGHPWWVATLSIMAAHLKLGPNCIAIIIIGKDPKIRPPHYKTSFPNGGRYWAEGFHCIVEEISYVSSPYALRLWWTIKPDQDQRTQSIIKTSSQVISILWLHILYMYDLIMRSWPSWTNKNMTYGAVFVLSHECWAGAKYCSLISCNTRYSFRIDLVQHCWSVQYYVLPWTLLFAFSYHHNNE